jgi:antirestriction protein ArdC
MNAEARTSIDHLLSTLKAELAQPGQSLIPLLTTMSRFTRYSLSNQLLIFAQRPTATHVMGYRSWLKAGYQVRKGEKGIAIYAPVRFVHRTRLHAPRQAVSTQGHGELTGKCSGRACGRRIGRSFRDRLGFRVTYVFDLAQVDPLRRHRHRRRSPHRSPTLVTHTSPTNGSKPSSSATTSSSSTRLLAPGLMGYTDGRRITCGIGQAAHVEFATLAHETAHVLLHFPTDGATRPDITTRETEAEAVTYLLCAQLGIAGTDASVEYIKQLPRHARHARCLARSHPHHHAATRRRDARCHIPPSISRSHLP